jgi:hypothetical protein
MQDGINYFPALISGIVPFASIALLYCKIGLSKKENQKSNR